MIPTEAVEAAARAYRHEFPYDENEGYVVQLILEAAAPYIRAQALEDAADEFENLPANKGAEISSGTYDWFELFPIMHIREQAAAERAPYMLNNEGEK